LRRFQARVRVVSADCNDDLSRPVEARFADLQVLEIRAGAQFSAGGKRSAPSQAMVFFAGETPLNPFGKSAATVHDESKRGGPARKAPRRVKRAKSRIWPM
jgi:hypothetical protein